MPTYRVVYETIVLVNAPDEAAARAHLAATVGAMPIVRIEPLLDE